LGGPRAEGKVLRAHSAIGHSPEKDGKKRQALLWDADPRSRGKEKGAALGLAQICGAAGGCAAEGDANGSLWAPRLPCAPVRGEKQYGTQPPQGRLSHPPTECPLHTLTPHHTHTRTRTHTHTHTRTRTLTQNHRTTSPQRETEVECRCACHFTSPFAKFSGFKGNRILSVGIG
jgi:hypothetical protein